MSADWTPEWLDREVACFLVAGVMIVVGTLATGFLPSDFPSQLVAGGLILGAFVLLGACLRETDPE